MKKRTKTIAKKRILRGPKKAQVPNLRLLLFPDKYVVLRDGEIWEQVDDFPAFYKIGKVICRLP